MGIVQQFYKNYEIGNEDLEAHQLPEESSEKSEYENVGAIQLTPDNRVDELPPYEPSIAF